MPNALFPIRGTSRRILGLAIAATLVISTLILVDTTQALADTNHTFQYVIVFQNGTRVSGETTEGTGNSAVVPKVGGSENPSVEDGMLIHMSCSDTFNLGLDPASDAYGFSDTGGQPAQDIDTAWAIADYHFSRANSNGGRCGNEDLLEPAEEFAALTIEKATNGVDADQPPGPSIPVTDPVVWTFEVTNTGDLPVWDILVADDRQQSISCEGQTNGQIQLDAGASISCRASSISWYAIYHFQHDNTATATGTSDIGTVSTSDVSHYRPTISCPFGGDDESIVVDLLSTNHGFLLGKDRNPDTLGPIAVDIPAGSYAVSWLSYDAHDVKPLDPTQTEEIWYLDAGGTTSQSTSDIPDTGDFASGTLSQPLTLTSDQSSLTVRHGGPSGKVNSVHAVCVELAPLTPSVDILKEKDQTILSGQRADFTITVTNDGDLPLNDVEVSDPKTPSCDFAAGDTATQPAGAFDGNLDVGESVVYECETGSLDSGFTNTATVTARVGQTPVPPASSSATVTVRDPEIRIDKWHSGDEPNQVDTQTIEPGDMPSFIIRVTNTGTANLEDVIVIDALAPGCDAAIGDLSVGSSTEYECAGPSTDASFTNVAQVTGKVVGFSRTVEDTDPSDVIVEAGDINGQIEILKLVDDLAGNFVEKAQYPAASTSATWQITVTNSTDQPLFEVDLEDLDAPACEAEFVDAMRDAGYESGGVLILPSAGSVTFECVSTISAGTPESNTATVVAIDLFERVVGPVSSTASIERIAASATIGDTVWADENENGKQDNGEKGIANAVVRLTGPDGTTMEMKTNSSGRYLFSGLEPGTYKAELVVSSIPVPQDGSLKLTTPGSYTVTLDDGQSYLDADFGVASTLPVTGFSSDGITVLGLGLLLIGSAAVLTARPTRRRTGDEVDAA